MTKRALLEALFFFSEDNQRLDVHGHAKALCEFVEYPPDFSSIDTVTLTKDGPL